MNLIDNNDDTEKNESEKNQDNDDNSKTNNDETDKQNESQSEQDQISVDGSFDVNEFRMDESSMESEGNEQDVEQVNQKISLDTSESLSCDNSRFSILIALLIPALISTLINFDFYNLLYRIKKVDYLK